MNVWLQNRIVINRKNASSDNCFQIPFSANPADISNRLLIYICHIGFMVHNFCLMSHCHPKISYLADETIWKKEVWKLSQHWLVVEIKSVSVKSLICRRYGSLNKLLRFTSNALRFKANILAKLKKNLKVGDLK